MTEFTQTLRHYCRNPRCRMRLKKPIENPHKAFCTPGCHSSFYLKRCLVCEQPIIKKLPSRELCNKPKCYSAFRDNRERYRYPRREGAKNPHEMGTKTSSHGGSALFAKAPLNILGGGSWRWPHTPQLSARILENIRHREIAAAPKIPPIADSAVRLVPVEHITSVSTSARALWFPRR